MNIENITLYLGVALAISEGLAMIPVIQSNGIFNLAYNILRSLGKALGKKKEIE